MVLEDSSAAVMPMAFDVVCSVLEIALALE